ncbi:MAG: hypothetical protein COB67_01930 [SAR324 cluster bacterium]|uniref:SpoVR protein-like N-terminal domain-containing protein n=1 Tax=SAR324 cluster bacterium TaxID=2024889 RepID=A0A2A4T9Z2_9DELT|nr:MAG: hypothetical protein COB67_01930 [SAR324 cluster bacterium]
MRAIRFDPELYKLEQRVMYHAKEMGRTLPEMRFFILNQMEFASLLEKHVFPTSPPNIWEGKRMVHKKYRIETGQESALYYEVVQTGNPSYAYLNNTNSPMMQASVMAHVVGHCEFSELNVLKDSNPDRTEFVLYLVRKVNRARQQMGEKNYLQYWNASESAIPLIAPHSQFNVDKAIETESRPHHSMSSEVEGENKKSLLLPQFHTMDSILKPENKEQAWEKELRKKNHQEALSRRGYRLRAPCQDILGFLRHFAPTSSSERAIMDYMYFANSNSDFVIRTQIMNEGWAMYWEKKIMMELFKERAVKGIIDYARVFSGVCSPRPYFNRNPYHLGFHMWTHIEELYRDGKVSISYLEEKDRQKRDTWKKEATRDPLLSMEHLLKTVTDYEFLRRFLTPDLIFKLHLNRILKRQAKQLQIQPDAIVKEDEHWIWLNPEAVKQEMLGFFTHFFRPRIYLIDADFQDGGLLLYHRYDQRELRKDWILPTLKNLNFIWKGPVSLISGNSMYTYSSSHFQDVSILEVPFERILERMQKLEKPYRP